LTIRVRDLKKIYKMGAERVHALSGVDLDIERNEFVAIMGASGSGKSTLMNILGCLDKPTSGRYELNSRPTHEMGAFELLPRMTALENVRLALQYSRKHWLGSRRMAREALGRVGLADRMGHRPNQMSGGQRQRVAIARALVNRPSMLLADEPTGNLDSATSVEILKLFEELHDEGQTIVMVTHEEDIAGHAERIVRLWDGGIYSDCPTATDPIHQDYLDRSATLAMTRAGKSDSRTVLENER